MVCCGSQSRGRGPGKFTKVGTSDLGFGNGACLPGGEKLFRAKGVEWMKFISEPQASVSSVASMRKAVTVGLPVRVTAAWWALMKCKRSSKQREHTT